MGSTPIVGSRCKQLSFRQIQLLYSPCADLYALGFGGELVENPEVR
jgi:hypothetical protein